jgi:hypothetical protein
MIAAFVARTWADDQATPDSREHYIYALCRCRDAG